MTDDRELLELAALAGGIELEYENGAPCKVELEGTYRKRTWWNPLTDDGDALRLAVACRLTVCTDGSATVSACEAWDQVNGAFVTQSVSECADKRAATRRAITRAAAEIGRQMRGEQHE